MQQWARVKFSHGIRTVPAGSLKFVDFSKPDPAEERVERFMIAAQRAMAEGEYAARRPAPDLRARRRAPQRGRAAADDARLLAGRQARRGRARGARLGARGWRAPGPHRFAARIYEDMGAIDLAEEAAERAAERGPSDAGAWERLGRLRLRLMDREGALEALRRALGTRRRRRGPRADRAGARARAASRASGARAQLAARAETRSEDVDRRARRSGRSSRARPIDCMPMITFAAGVSGIVSVGEKAVALVSETYGSR